MTPVLHGIGVISWLMGVRWFGLSGMGLRLGRAMLAGIGFSLLGWIAVMLARFMQMPFGQVAQGGLGRVFFYLLLIEAFALQLWAFGALFRALVEWQNPITATLLSGLAFGVVGYALFETALDAAPAGLVYYLIWGIFYAVIRLRTGSFLGIILIQAMQTLTSWYLLDPGVISATQTTGFSIVAGALTLILIWRLWPRRESDYRI
ncbi:MAG: CPBP family intramembrane metalloprotease [Methylococcales bacterium]|nr:CPBP family intramembrane metalloprotease [Methylococcales bacterium]